MKLLFAANRFPYPPFRGDKLKIYHLAKRLAVKHELHLLTFLEDKNDLQYLPELQKIFKDVHLVKLSKWQSYWNCLPTFFREEPFQIRYFHSPKMHQKIGELLKQNNYDAVHVQHLRMAQYWNDKKNIPRILDLPDAYSLYWKRRVDSKKGLMRSFTKTEYIRMYNYEHIINDFDKALVCSKEDKQYLQDEHQLYNVDVLPNGVDLTTFSCEAHDYSPNKTILFTGNMDYAPNVDAVEYFANDIFPSIVEKIPEVKFIIAGQRPVKKVLQLASENIEVTGFVKDLSVMYRRASIVVAPLRFGAGTQNKVLEAMAMGVPVVSHHIGFNGLNIQSGEGVILATELESFIQSCITLLGSDTLRQSVGEAGKKVVMEQFDWDTIAAKLENYLLEAIHINKQIKWKENVQK